MTLIEMTVISKFTRRAQFLLRVDSLVPGRSLSRLFEVVAGIAICYYVG